MASYVPANGKSLLVGPVYHSAQWAFTFMPMINGSSVVMRHKFDGAETVELIDSEKITNIHLVPTQFKRMLDPQSRSKKRSLETLLNPCGMELLLAQRLGNARCLTGLAPRCMNTMDQQKERLSLR